jgi:flagellar biosynthesis chaperone FliJ
MVQTDLSQLNRECNSWRETLRNYRTELSEFRNRLQELVSKSISRSEMPQVEHYDNQIDIQLRNINQLKHEIKDHERNSVWEQGRTSGSATGNTWSRHEALLDRYEILEHTINDLKEEFRSFLQKLG